MPSYNNDPYSAGQKATGGAAMNGTRGSQTPGSMQNANFYAQGKGDPFSAYGSLGAAWSSALGNKSVGSMFSGNGAMNLPPTVTYGDGSGGTTHTAPYVRGANPYGNNPAPPGSTTVIPSTMGGQVSGFGTGGYTAVNPLDGVNTDIRRRLQTGNSLTTTPTPFGGYQSIDREGGRSGFNPTAPPFYPDVPPLYPETRPPATPSTQPVDTPTAADIPPTITYRDPVTGGTTHTPPSRSNVGGLNDPAPRGSTTIIPSTLGRPGASPYGNYPAPPGSTSVIPSTAGGAPRPANTEDPQVAADWYRTFPGFEGVSRDDVDAYRANPQGMQFADWYRAGNRGNVPALPGGGAGNKGPGQSVTTRQFTPTGQPLGQNGIGRRYGPGYGGQPIGGAGEQGASGRPVTMRQWVKGADGRNTLVEVDANGNPVNQTQTTTGGSTGGSTSTTTTTTGAPDTSRKFDPNVLPDSNVGSWLDPVMNDTLERVRREALHAGSLTGATNSGGFVPGLSEELGRVGNQFLAQKGQLMFEDQNRKADRLLDVYKFDNTQQLQRWVEENRQELERYGIDQNVLLGRYQADQQAAAANANASASMYGADAAAGASRYNAGLDFLSQIYGTDANSALGRDRLGYDYWNTGQNLGYNYWNSAQNRAYDDVFNQRAYDLGVFGINRDVYGMDQAQQRYLMDLMWRMSPGGQMGGGYFPLPNVFPYGG